MRKCSNFVPSNETFSFDLKRQGHIKIPATDDWVVLFVQKQISGNTAHEFLKTSFCMFAM